ncbi:hypothetical protein DFQ27_003171 [Actinomortierella ambigua]|uniref:Protein kinase domain-containing protein n=1 Tax=Actinomortierella ambigua TaxID=1343610 RepID=A0A9P6Q5D4_9FUNG|nr:hypothetical protein DFQ27_003171 [Actinomortierella ambigua]
MLERLSYRHIIQFYGTTNHEGSLAIVTDLAERGSLKHAILNDTIPAKDWSTNARLAQEIARGLAYIHSEGILHLDLKSDNVLLSRHMEVKAAISSRSSEMPKGTVRWMAPELFERRPLYSFKSDVYSLGMVLWELAAHCTLPFKDHLNNTSVSLIIGRGEREILPDDTPPMYRRWVERCWDLNPQNRPDSRDLALEGIECEVGDEKQGLAVSVEAANLAVTANATKGTGMTAVAQQAIVSDVTSGAGGSGSSEGRVSDRTLPVAKDEEKEFARYLREAMEGNASSQNVVGCMYLRGRGTMASREEAYRWFSEAAKGGNASGQYSLGSMYKTGLGVLQSEYKAVEWFQKSADQGCAEGQRALAKMLSKGRGVVRDKSKAAQLFQEAAKQGDLEAAFQLGQMYERGNGVKQGYTQAFTWYKKAAAKNDSRAQNALGWAFCFGQGAQQNDAKALEWYGKSAAKDHGPALFNLGLMYELGLGVAQSDDEALIRYHKAFDHGILDAKLHIDWLTRPNRSASSLSGATELFKLYFKEASNGYAASQYGLGVIIELGRGISVDRKIASKWHNEAAAQGHYCAGLRKIALAQS